MSEPATDPMPPACVAQLRAELVRAAARRRSGSRPRAVALALLVAAGAAVALTRPVPAAADVRIERHGDRLEVALTDLEHRPEHIEGVLRGVGLEATVVGAPVGPSEVGRFVGTIDGAGLAPEVHRIDAGPLTFAGFSVPVGWRGHLVLQVGRPAAPGEAYAAFSDALAPGEPLACRRLLGMPPAELAALLDGLDLDVLVQAGPAHPLSRTLSGGAEGTVVRSIDATGPTQVIVRLGPPAPTPPASTSPECPA